VTYLRPAIRQISFGSAAVGQAPSAGSATATAGGCRRYQVNSTHAMQSPAMLF
jgi:hypothetical protein